MERFPMLWNDRPCGELTVEREGLYTRFSARGKLPSAEELWCAWVIGERGRLRLGVLEPSGDSAAICRRFSGAEITTLGRVLRSELHRQGEEPQVWTVVGEPERLFRDPWLRQRLRGMQHALTCKVEGIRFLALPWDKKQPFPLVPLFCLARLQCIGSRYYVVYAFDSDCKPVFERP